MQRSPLLIRLISYGFLMNDQKPLKSGWFALLVQKLIFAWIKYKEKKPIVVTSNGFINYDDCD